MAAVEIGKRYVSYHLVCVYLEPGLLAGVSPELIGRMQGTSCFNFTNVDDVLFGELEALTARGSVGCSCRTDPAPDRRMPPTQSRGRHTSAGGWVA